MLRAKFLLFAVVLRKYETSFCIYPQWLYIFSRWSLNAKLLTSHNVQNFAFFLHFGYFGQCIIFNTRNELSIFFGANTYLVVLLNDFMALGLWLNKQIFINMRLNSPKQLLKGRSLDIGRYINAVFEIYAIVWISCEGDSKLVSCLFQFGLSRTTKRIFCF